MPDVASFLTSAYDCEWCVPYQPNVGPVTHYQTDKQHGDERYAEHWFSRIPNTVRSVLMFRIPGPATTAKSPVRPVTRSAKASTTMAMKGVA